MIRAFLLLAFAATLVADWPQWRGPHRDGVLTDFSEPATWPEKLTQAWKITVGEGHASPILGGGRVYVFARQSDQEMLYAIDPESGKILWRESYEAPYSMNPAAVRHGKGPKSTPVYANGKVYTFGITGVLSCYDAATGNRRWRKEFAREFPETSPLFGTAMSPIVDNGLLIAHVGGNDKGALVAFDPDSGEKKWSWTGDGPGYASPIVADLAGARQVITQTQQFIVAVDEKSGALLWKIPFTTPYVQNSVTPLAAGDLLIFSGLSNPTMAVKVIRKGDRFETEKIWQNAEASMYLNSPVRKGDLVFGLTSRNKGQYFCLDARSGKTLWTSGPRQGDNAAIEISGSYLFLLNSDGELIVAKADGKAFQPVRRYTVASSPTWAHPLVTGHGVYVKDFNTLVLWRGL